jgi:hypothetical protein
MSGDVPIEIEDKPTVVSIMRELVELWGANTDPESIRRAWH